MSTEDTPQNIYDDPGFFAGYSSMERFGAGWDKAAEQPSFLGLLPELVGKRVLDLGCGAGRLCLHLALDRYSDEGFREHEWFVAGVRRYHRTMATLVNTLLDSGFTLERLIEPVPSDEWLGARPGIEFERRRPIFLLVRGRKTRSIA